MAETGQAVAVDVHRLREAMRRSADRLRPHREARVAGLRGMVGPHYGRDRPRTASGAPMREPLNLLELTVSTFVSYLVSHRPKVFCTTTKPELVPAALSLELGLNKFLDQGGFGRKLRSVVRDSMFGPGLIKAGYDHNTQRAFADPVDLDDWVVDMNAREWDHIQFCGNRYRLPVRYVKESGLYEHAERFGAAPPGSEDGGADRAEDLQSGGQRAWTRDDYYPMGELWDVWLPLEGVVVTFDAQGDDRVMRQVQWAGPSAGPYRMLSLMEVPAQVMPLAPCTLWKELHDLANRIMVKVGRQADSQKKITGYTGQARRDAERLLAAEDQEFIQLDLLDQVREFQHGGVDPRTLAFLIQLKQLFSWQAGNLDSLAGLGVMADTATDNQMLARTASRRPKDMQKLVMEFTKSVVTDLAWYLWNDPDVRIQASYQIPGTSITVPIEFGPESRRGRLEDYEIDVHPYSEGYDSPFERLMSMEAFLARMVMPALPMFQAQGMTIDLPALIALRARYGNQPELLQIVRAIEPQAQAGGGAQPPGMPAETNRTYTRVNRSAGTEPGRDAMLMRSLLGGAGQDGEMSNVGLG